MTSKDDRLGREGQPWDRVARRYDRLVGGDDAFYGEVARLLGQRLGPEDTVLDIACGTGLLSVEAARVARRVCGVDLAPRMIAQAEARRRRLGLANLDLLVGDGCQLPLVDGAFDLVLCARVLNVVEAPERLLGEAHRVLRDGGLLLTATDCDAESTGLRGRVTALVLRLARALGVLPALRLLRGSELDEMIRGAGFVAVEWRAVDFRGKRAIIIGAAKGSEGAAPTGEERS